MSNPYLAQQAGAITQQATQNLNQNILPGLNRGSVASGGYGGSRQGIAQGLAIGQTNQGITNSLAGLYGNAYEGDQNRQNQASMQSAALASQQRIAELQDSTNRFGLGNQFTLGLGNLGLGFGNLELGNRQADQSFFLGNRNADTNQFGAETQRELGFGQLGNQAAANNQSFYTQQRGQDLQSQGQGFQQYLQALQAQLGLGQGVTNIGQQQQQAPGNALGQYANLLSPFTGLNQSNTQTQPGGGGGVAGAVGGALTAAQLWSILNQPRP